MNDILAQKIKGLPQQSGVYLMRNRDGEIIYIGKAKVLKNRVSQYFQHSAAHTPKVLAMVSNIVDFDYVITNTEADALTLEATLIKRHKPFYNILLKDDKARPYIRIDFRKDYPTIEVVRKVKADGAKYFGPYFNGINVKDVVEIVKSAFQVRACSGHKWSSSHRVCLNYHIGLCSGACKGLISKEDYRAQMQRVVRFLEGHDDEVAGMLADRMKKAASEQRYEQAMIYRDRLAMLDRLGARSLAELPKGTDLDVFGYATDFVHAAISVLIVRGGKMIACDNFPIIDASFSAAECLSSFLVQYYDGTRMLPHEIVLPEKLEDEPALKDYLRAKYPRAVAVTVPVKAVKKALCENAATNAKDYLAKSVVATERKRDMTVGAVERLQKTLGLSKPPRRMECYDISNVSGTDKVASMAVFFDGEPDKSSYRRFRIKTVEGSNDFASMKEVLSRRLAHLDDGDDHFGAMPDLIVIDGGKGQLSYSVEAMQETGHFVDMVSLAEREEEIFVPGQSEPIVLPRESYELRLLQRIRDEAHRFAVTYHRSLRANRYLSRLESIEGVGRERRIALITEFGSLTGIANASIEDIAAVRRIGTKLATLIRQKAGEFAAEEAESARSGQVVLNKGRESK